MTQGKAKISRRASPAERRQARAEIDDPAVVMDAAASFLSVRPRSVAETRRRLRHLGYRHELVEQVVERLVEMRYLDDEAFARLWVESRDRARPRGVISLRRELAQKGVERSVIDAVLEAREGAPSGAAGEPPADPAVADDATVEPRASPDEAAARRLSPDESAATRLLERRLPALIREPDERRRRQKAYALLARNGFDPEICREVSASVLGSGPE